MIGCSVAKWPSADYIKKYDYQEVKADLALEGQDSVKIETLPMYPKGLYGLAVDLANAVDYPSEAVKKNIEGRVVVEFVVNEQGRPENAKIVTSTNSIFNETSLKAVYKLKRWIPGSQRGKYVKVRLSQPIRFKLS